MTEAPFLYLKWNDSVVGLVMSDLSVQFVERRFNTAVTLYTHGETTWSPDTFLEFLSERIMSRGRRDIERLLFRCGLSEYDTFKIADATHAINPRDELWLAREADERFYPLYDNGRSLFYEDTEEFARKAAANPQQYATTFGFEGIYWDHVQDIAASLRLLRALDENATR